MYRKTILSLAAAGFLAACASGDGPRVGENTGLGAAIGTAIGAGVGAIVAGDSRKGALIGAGVGLLAGAAAGAKLDRQQQELEKNLEGTGATVTNTGEELIVNLPSEVTFDFDSDRIKNQFKRPLRDVAKTMRDYPSFLIDIVGHTDSVGSDAYNQGLSERRAEGVADFLTERRVIRERIVAYGEGETRPIATNDTEAGRAQNRRVEIIITPATQDS